jgi:hypothetical protein
MKKNKFLQLFALTSIMFLLPVSSYAAGVTLDSMFANFSDSGLAIIKLIQVAARVIGLYLVIGSIFKFVQLGAGNGQVTPKVPIMMFFTGIAIFVLGGSVTVFMQTMAMSGGPGDVLAPPVSGGIGKWTAGGIRGVLIFIQMIGYIAFIRGWLMLNQHAQGKDGMMGRALTHLFGGVAAINIGFTAKMLANTFAPGLTLPL